MTDSSPINEDVFYFKLHSIGNTRVNKEFIIDFRWYPFKSPNSHSTVNIRLGTILSSVKIKLTGFRSPSVRHFINISNQLVSSLWCCATTKHSVMPLLVLYFRWSLVPQMRFYCFWAGSEASSKLNIKAHSPNGVYIAHDLKVHILAKKWMAAVCISAAAPALPYVMYCMYNV